MKLPQFVTTFALICNKIKLPQFITQACLNLQYIYIFVIEFCCSYYNLCDLGWEYLIHLVTWLIDHVITWYAKKALSPPSLGQWPPILARCDLRCDLVTVKAPHLLFQVTCRSSDHVLFEKLHVFTNARPQNSVGNTKHRKTHEWKVFLVIQKMLTFDSHRYTQP